jgi:multiple sugar transport system substrate-binding protein
VIAACERLQDPPNAYGYVMRGERGNPIRFDWTPFMLGHGAEIVRDPENGDYTVTINSPEAKAALDTYIDVAKRCGPPNIGSLGQGDVIQLLSTGKAVQGHVVTAAWPSFEDPQKSAVVGKLQPAVMPRPENGQPGVVIGNWHLGIPKNLSDDRKRAALAFSRWFLTEGAQRAYAEAGAIPVRTDVLQSDLAERPEFRWMKPYLDSMPHARQVLGYAEGAAVEEALGLRLNQALIGEMSVAAALNAAATDIAAIFERSGRRTGTLPPLDE